MKEAHQCPYRGRSTSWHGDLSKISTRNEPATDARKARNRRPGTFSTRSVILGRTPGTAVGRGEGRSHKMPARLGVGGSRVARRSLKGAGPGLHVARLRRDRPRHGPQHQNVRTKNPYLYRCESFIYPSCSSTKACQEDGMWHVAVITTIAPQADDQRVADATGHSMADRLVFHHPTVMRHDLWPGGRVAASMAQEGDDIDDRPVQPDRFASPLGRPRRPTSGCRAGLPAASPQPSRKRRGRRSRPVPRQLFQGSPSQPVGRGTPPRLPQAPASPAHGRPPQPQRYSPGEHRGVAATAHQPRRRV